VSEVKHVDPLIPGVVLFHHSGAKPVKAGIVLNIPTKPVTLRQLSNRVAGIAVNEVAR